MHLLKKLISGEDNIIIGDNSSGKSEILMKLALELKEKRKNIYFIDSVNRSFDTSKATLSPIGKDREQKTNVGESMEYLNRVIDVRVSEQKFNLVDSFGDIYKIEELYFLFEENLKDLFLEFVGKEFQMERLPIPELGILKNVSIFSDLFFDKETKSTSSNDEIDTRLRQMLNMKLIDSWNEELEKEFVELGSKQLAPHQKLIYLQIKEW